MSPNSLHHLIPILQEVAAKTKRNGITFLTGAGISADSGIPTYRGSDGIWVKGTRYHKPEEFGTFRYFRQNPKEVWQYTLFRKKMFEGAQPNSSHLVLAELEKQLGSRFHLITQNVDGLHRRAGNQHLYEIHGNYREVKCAGDCSDVWPIPPILKAKEETEDLTLQEKESLGCPNCGDWLRPNILWFDEFYDERTHKKFSALKVAKRSGILFVVGTSGATNLPIEIARTTLKYGGYVIDLNPEPNHFTELLRDKKRGIVLRQTSAAALPQIQEMMAQAGLFNAV